MFYHFLGKIFLYFYVLPSIARGLSFAAPIISQVLSKAIADFIEEEMKPSPAEQRKNHPAGSRLR